MEKASGPVELDKVLLIADGGKVTVGKPAIEGARVLATAQGNGRDKKIIVFKYKPKVRYRRKTGHRQHFTTLSIDKILPPGAEAPKPAAKKAAPKPTAKKAAPKPAARETAAKPAATKTAAKPAAKKAAPRRKKKEVTPDGA
jgi:large subunit ribosomal protein L21